MAKATEAERDTLRRLLTETAVPALESALLWLEAAYSIPPQTPDAVLMLRGVKTSISTIRAQMENSTAAPQPERCSTCDDTRIVYGHGGFDGRCPACYASDAEAGLAMLGGDGRG